MKRNHDPRRTEEEIIALYWSRNEEAIRQTADTLGHYCYTVAYNILGNPEDAEECVNDTYLALWNAIPPARPASFKHFVTRILRNLALNRYKEQNRDKRGGGQVITCGLDRRCTLTASSLLQEGGMAALQRTMHSLRGEEIQPQEVPLAGLPVPEGRRLTAAAVLLLLGVENRCN